MSLKDPSDASLEAQEALLYSSRHGELLVVTKLLEAKKAGEITLNVSCKGQSKSNLGWSPLHLATYFGHIDVAEVLLVGGADVNAANDLGDTPLHKAAFIGREELAVLLLKYGADINIMNGEGRLPRDVCKTEDINRLLVATEQAEQRNRENSLLTAAREGDLDAINKLLSESQAPSINCVDAQGNTALHCAAYRGHAHVAVILLQNGVDSSIRNKTGQLAIDMARDSQMREILSVRPVRQLQRTATRYEGPLMKRSRFLGWKPVWAVLQRGVLVYYGSRGEAAESEGCHTRRTRKYLDGARVTPANTEHAVMVIHYSDGDTHRLAVPTPRDSTQDVLTARQTWMTALKEHIEYSGHYLWAGGPREAIEELEDCRPLGSMQEALTGATSSIALFESQLRECGAIVAALEDSQNVGSSLYQSAYMRFQHVSSTGQRSLVALRHCCALVSQAREAADARVRDQAERTRVLEEALAALAREHHQLEMSYAEEVSGQSKKYKKKRSSPKRVECSDSFFDAYEADSDSDTLMTAGLSSPLGALSPWEATPESSPVHRTSADLTPTNPASPEIRPTSNLSDSRTDSFVSLISPLDPLRSTDSVMSLASSCGTLVSHGGHVYRDACDDVRLRVRHKPRKSLPVPQFSRNDFSLWSVLRNNVGKELSKITMPVVFNEPLSFLQRMLEYLEYAHLLRMASEQEDPVKRMEYIAGFAVSALASNWERLGKPFNPLLGETYELQRPEFRAVCEQVSHHPPVSAFHADSPHFVFHGSVHPKLKFCGKSVEIQPRGHVTVELPRWGEAYTWSNVNCCVHNVIVGRLWIEQYGNMEVICHGGAGLRASLTFKAAGTGWASKQLHRVEGFIADSNKRKLRYLYGKWTEFIKCCSVTAFEDSVRARGAGQDGGEARADSSPAHTPKRVLAKLNSLKVGLRSMSFQEPDEPPECVEGEPPCGEGGDWLDVPGAELLWEAMPRPANSAEYYQFTSFAMSLNEMEEGQRARLCPTDSRLRPDVRRLEAGDIDGAAGEKTRLEDKQRASRKLAKKNVHAFQARWFCQGTNPYTKQEDWLYSGGYWDRNYQHLTDIDIF